MGRRARVREQERALAEVIEEEGREHDRVPGRPDGPSPKMPHIRVEGLAARHDEEDGPQHEEPLAAIVNKERDAVARVQREQDVRVRDDLPRPEHGDNGEPHERDRAEHLADARGPPLLDEKEGEEDPGRERQYQGLQRGRRHLQALHRAQDRDSGRDHAVAVEERRPEEGH